jgi:hypothetical protein
MALAEPRDWDARAQRNTPFARLRAVPRLQRPRTLTGVLSVVLIESALLMQSRECGIFRETLDRWIVALNVKLLPAPRARSGAITGGAGAHLLSLFGTKPSRLLLLYVVFEVIFCE